MAEFWKDNWNETKDHFCAWWERKGLVLGAWSAVGGAPQRSGTQDPGPPRNLEQRYADPVWRALHEHHRLGGASFPGDVLPLANTNIGPGSLALLLGSQPDFSETTIWYEPCIEDPGAAGPLVFDPANRWWKIHEAITREMMARAQGQYFVGCADLIEGIDILASLRGSETMLYDFIERPGWVRQKVAEINQVWFSAYERLYDIIKLEDGSSAWAAFSIWGPGKTAKVQCDAAAMIGPDMFADFVVPALDEQCAWLDYSMYHLDGTQAMVHLDLLLGIEALDAIEWTPQSGLATGADKEWHDLYKRILAGGKSLQILNVKPEEVAPLLDEIGGNGVYLMIDTSDEKGVERAVRAAEPYR